MQKVSTALNLLMSHASPFKNLLNFSKNLPNYGKLFVPIFSFRETFMQMSTGRGGDFTTTRQL